MERKYLVINRRYYHENGGKKAQLEANREV